jgi:hypothetical protein
VWTVDGGDLGAMRVPAAGRGGLDGLDLKNPELVGFSPLAQVEDFNAYNPAVGIIIQDNTWLNFLRRDNRALIQAQAEGIAFFVNYPLLSVHPSP